MTDVAAITSSTGTTGTQRTPGSTLGKDQFLQLLTTQLKYQDPLNPMDDKDFIGQMAQFSALEQTTNMATSLERMESASQVTQGVSLIGHTVQWLKDGQTVSGQVQSISLQDGAIHLKVGDDDITPSDVTGVL